MPVLLWQTAIGIAGREQSYDSWQRYMANGEEFSAVFPELPTMTTYDNFWKGGTGRKERMIAAYVDGAVLAIYCFDTSDQNQTLKQFVQEMVNSYLPGAGVRYERDTNVSGVPGMEASFTSRDVIGSVQFYKTKRHSYAIAVVGIARNHPSAERFFSLLQFDPKPSGLQLKDGTGQDIANAAGNTLNVKDVSRKPIVVVKPPPAFTSLAEKDGTQGTVLLRAMFSSTGRVTEIEAVKSLPNGLTENAIAAARRIRFIPAMKDGQFVSMWMELEYNFYR